MSEDTGHVKDMALTPEERKDEKKTLIADDDGPKFPFGLTIHLDERTLQKLGITELPEPGTKKILLAQVVCERIAKREDADGLDRSIDLQITHMGLTPDNDKHKVRAAEKSLYK